MGKTGTDAIINLLEEHQIEESQITWVISRDVWYFLRDAMEDFYHSFDIFRKMAEANSVVCEKGSFDFSPDDTVLVDCMVDNLYGYNFKEDFQIFEPNRINLGPLTLVFNVSMSSAHIAFLECALDKKNNKNKNKKKTKTKNNTNTNND